jgi:HEAT repeat protein
LSDDNWQVRREAAAALGRFPGQATEAALRDTLGDAAWPVAREAAFRACRPATVNVSRHCSCMNWRTCASRRPSPWASRKILHGLPGLNPF